MKPNTILSPSLYGSIVLGLALISAQAQAIQLERIATGFEQPLFATAPSGDSSRLFVLEKASGNIKIIRLANNAVLAEPFLRVSDISSQGERGLLGLAFHPNYASNGEFFVSVTNLDGDSEIRRYTRDTNPDRANSNSAEVLLTIPQFASNHNGGWIGFGPDGFLYVSSGDGGGGNDPQLNGQDLTTLLGTILRIDVNGDDFPNDNSRNYRIPDSNPFIGTEVNGTSARPEIWAYGLRNPWRASFDRQTGDLLIADVGQGAREEINFQPADSPGGENYGWRLREGEIATPSVGGARPSDNREPIYTYQRSGSVFAGTSVTGGYSYRGPVSEIRGNYFFADFANGRIWSLVPTANGFSQLTFWSDQLTPNLGSVNSVASFGEDANGNLYIVDFDGDIFRFVSNNPPPSNIRGTLLPATTILLNDDS